MCYKVFALCSLCLCGAFASPARADYSSILAFGDSLSDVGNTYAATFGFSPGGAPYYNGHYSNGPVWLEDLATDQGLALPTKSRSGGLDYAYGGATTDVGTTSVFIWNLQKQVTSYLGSHSVGASQLVTLWCGANDFLNGGTSTTGSINNISASIGSLAAAGAKTFIVPNLPLLGQTPEYRSAANAGTLNALSTQFNAQLATTLNNLSSSLNLQIYQLDVASFFGSALSSPSTYGFTNVTDSAYNGSTVVSNPDQYLFWDGVHPTRIGHSLLGQLASDQLDTHAWSAAAASANFSSASSWNPQAAPTARWIASLSNTTATSPRSALVSSATTIRSASVGGASSTGLMTLKVTAGATLAASGSINIATRGQLDLTGARVTSPTVHIGSGGALAGGGGTINGALSLDAGSTFNAHLGEAPLTITGAAALAGTLDVALADGAIALPGDSFNILGFVSSTGSLSLHNDTGFAGLSFAPTYSSTSLSITAIGFAGDANLDGIVNIDDLGALANHWQAAGNWLDGDFDHNGIIDIADLGLLASHWQSSSPISFAGLTVVPEPSSIAVFFALILPARRRRHGVTVG